MTQLEKQIQASEKRIAKYEKNMQMYEARMSKKLELLQKQGYMATREDFQIQKTGKWKYDYDITVSEQVKQQVPFSIYMPVVENLQYKQENTDRLADEKETLNKLKEKNKTRTQIADEISEQNKVLAKHLGESLAPFKKHWMEDMTNYHREFYHRIHKALPNARVQYDELQKAIYDEKRKNGFRPSTLIKQLEYSRKAFGRILSAPPAAYPTEESYMNYMKPRLEDEYKNCLYVLADKCKPFQLDTEKVQVHHPRMAERGFDLLLTDGKDRVIDARMIWAAENSDYMVPHTRYIVTERKTKEQEQKEIPDNFKDSIDMNESKPLQLQLAIQGHATRGNEVIDILKWLGGKNPHSYTGDNPKFHYEIDDFDGYLRKLVVTGKNGEYGYLGYTLEQFLEKYPYKKGDSVICNADTPRPVLHAKWENNQVLYSLDKEGLCWYSADKIKPHEKAIERTNETDCDADRKEVEGAISNERLWPMGGGEAAELHKQNLEELNGELKDILDGNYSAVIDKYVSNMGEEVGRNVFADFMKENVPVKNAGTETLFLDALTDIAMYAGWKHLEFEDSKQRSLTLRNWAKEFVETNRNTDWEQADYIDLVDKFAEQKVNGWMKLHPLKPSYRDRISDINVYSGLNARTFIRCKIDGEQQTAVQLSFADAVNFNDRTDRMTLAARYFKEALESNESQNRGPKR